jgi:hypothetical protein
VFRSPASSAVGVHPSTRRAFVTLAQGAGNIGRVRGEVFQTGGRCSLFSRRGDGRAAQIIVM